MKQNRFLSLIIVLILMLALPLTVSAAQPEYVTDEAGLLTDFERQLLDDYARQVSETYGCGVYIMTVEDYHDYARQWGMHIFDVVAEYYHANNLGEGSGRDGILLMLSMEDRDFAFFVYGDGAEYALDEYGQLQLEEAFLDPLGRDDWYGGLTAYIEFCQKAFQAAAEGDPIRENHTGEYFFAIFIAIAIAAIVTFCFYAPMKSVRSGSAAAEYAVPGGLALTVNSDKFVNQTVTVRKKSQQSGSGGSHSGHGGSGRSGKF